MWWLLWFIPTVYSTVAIVTWTLLARSDYKEFVADGKTGLRELPSKYWDWDAGQTDEMRYDALKRQRNQKQREEIENLRLDVCKDLAFTGNARVAWFWPLFFTIIPFFWLGNLIRWAATSGVDKEIQAKRDFEKAQRIVEEYNAKKKAEEDKIWKELES